MIKQLDKKIPNKLFLFVISAVLVSTLVLALYQVLRKQIFISSENADLVSKNEELSRELVETKNTIASISAEIERLQNEDLRKTNQGLRQEIDKLKNTFRSSVSSYEALLDLRDASVKVTTMESQFASVLNFLSKDDLTAAQKILSDLTAAISKEKARLLALSTNPPAGVIPANVPAINQAPGSGYSRQKVEVGGSSFLVDIVAADLNSTRVIVDTASDGTCTNNCPVLPLATYVSRSGAYAGINGTYFCPETYPSCADKKNSFDTLVMNKNKVYFNSDNNVYSTVPVAVFSGSSARFIGQSSGWGRDTGVDSVIANRPLLVLDGNLMFGGGGEEKEVIRGNRSFLGASGSTGYIGVVHNASVAESAKVLQAMGVKSAINLDDGGSTALWSGGYKAGPGRNLPNVVLFVRK